MENIECKVHFVNSSSIVVETPAMEAEGHKDMEIVCEDGKEMFLPQILLYVQREEEQKIQEEEKRYTTEDEDFSIVKIHHLNPVVSPMHGTMIELSGQNIDSDAMVFIDDVLCDFVEPLSPRGDTKRIVFLSPNLLIEGMKEVKIQNKDGTTATLDNVLYYGDL